MPHPGRDVLVGRPRLGGLYGDIRKGMDSLEESAAQAHLLRPLIPSQVALASHACLEGMYLSEGRSHADFVAVSGKG